MLVSVITISKWSCFLINYMNLPYQKLFNLTALLKRTDIQRHPYLGPSANIQQTNSVVVHYPWLKAVQHFSCFVHTSSLIDFSSEYSVYYRFWWIPSSECKLQLDRDFLLLTKTMEKNLCVELFCHLVLLFREASS